MEREMASCTKLLWTLGAHSICSTRDLTSTRRLRLISKALHPQAHISRGPGALRLLCPPTEAPTPCLSPVRMSWKQKTALNRNVGRLQGGLCPRGTCCHVGKERGINSSCTAHACVSDELTPTKHAALPRASLPLKGNPFFMGSQLAPGSCTPRGDGHQPSQQLSP